MKQKLTKIIAVILTLMMAISAMPFTALATTTECIVYSFDCCWHDDDDDEITDGYVELAPSAIVNVANYGSGQTVTITNSFSDVMVGSGYAGTYSLSNNNSTINNYNNSKTYYLLLDGTSVTVTDENPAGSTVTISAGTGGTVSPSSVTGIKSGTEISVYESTLYIGEEEIIEATANDGYEFDSWSGVPSDGKITADITITANFKEKKTYQTEGPKITAPTSLAGWYVANYAVSLSIEDLKTVIDTCYDDDGFDSTTWTDEQKSKLADVLTWQNPSDSEDYYPYGTVAADGTFYGGTLANENYVAFFFVDNAELVSDAHWRIYLANKMGECTLTEDDLYMEGVFGTGLIDRSALKSAITEAKDYASKDYYNDLTDLNIAITDAQEVYDNASAKQTEIDSFVKGIQSAINALELKTYDFKVYKNGELEYDEEYTYGTIIDYTAELEDGESVYKWVKSTDAGDTLLANNTEDISVVVNGNIKIYYYTETEPSATATTAMVKYVDKSEKVVAIDTVTIGGAYTPDDSNAPSLAFYEFAGWDVVQGNLTSATKVGIILKAKYTVSKTEANKVTLKGLNGATINDTAEYTAYYDEKLTLAGGDNFAFCDKDGNEISSINSNVIYAPHSSSTIYIKAVDEKSEDASTAITGSFTQNGEFTVTAQYYLPDGCKAVEAGLVVSKTVVDPTIGADGCTKLVSSSQGDNHEYSMTFTCSSSGTLNTKSYLIYMDADDVLHTVYSEANALSYGA